MKHYIENYGIVTDFVLNRFGRTQILSRFICKWNSREKHKYVCKTLRFVAPTMDMAIDKASAIMGYKPSLTQRI